MINKMNKIKLVCCLVAVAGIAFGCGSDVGDLDLDNLTNDDVNELRNNEDFCQEPGVVCDDAEKPPRIPECRAQGSRGEGWYWADTGEIIRYEICSRDTEPQCGHISSRSEGWYSDNGLIVWDQCHRTVRIALWGETCGGSIGFECYQEGNLYCQGMPSSPGIIGGTGTCREIGFCEVDLDCDVEGNNWPRHACEGYSRCVEHTCNWICEELEPTVWSWTTVLSNEVETDHPYTSYSDQTWTITREGASKIQLNLTADVEYYYDWIVIYGKGEQNALFLTGQYEDFWTQEFEGDTVYIYFHSDYCIEDWGLKVEAVSYLEQIPRGTCNTSEDCTDGLSCQANLCENPFVPCYGECN